MDMDTYEIYFMTISFEARPRHVGFGNCLTESYN